MKIIRFLKWIEWISKIAIGWCCYRLFMATEGPIGKSAMSYWILSWAGFYAYDTGFDDFLARTNNG